jgi:osmotically-inducible protein OsmY
MKKPVAKMLGVATLVAVTTLGVGCATTGGGDSTLMADLLTERAINRALLTDASFDGDSVSASCVDGVVTLFGRVDNALDKSLAEQIVRRIDGVVSVNNNITTSS